MTSQLRILVLEDEPLDAELAVATLEAAGYSVVWERVADRESFLGRLDQPRYDLILADYSLPAFDGVSALRLARERALDIPFILVSGTLGEEVAIDSLKAGATDYVMKQRLDRLPPVVRRALREYADQQAHARAAEERRRLEEQLHRAQRMEVIGRLAGGIAHDFNNLLSVILGNVQLAQLDLPHDDATQSYLTDIEGAATRAARLTRQLLAFSRRQPIEQRLANLNEILRDVVKMLQPLIGEDIAVELLAAPDLAPVLVDPAQIEQVVMNLAINARDAMLHGGHLRIETANVPPGELLLPSGQLVRLTMADTGAGMSAEVRRHIFEPFFTTKEEGKGTGLGLSVVYGIVQQHGGQIDVDTEEGRGTSFHIYLPAASAGASGERRPHPAAAAGGSEAILVAEDEPMVREMVRNTLERLGYQVRLAADGREALELLRSGQHCDLLLLDMVMPHMGGYEVFEHARAIGLRIPVVFMTGHSVELAGHRFGSDTQALFIQKPFRMEELGRQVRRALEGRPV